MTSASELFHSRRYRSGNRHNAVGVTGIDSSPADVTSSYQHRSVIRRHSQHYGSQHNRREHRHEFDGCVPASRRIHRRLFEHLEHEAEESGSNINSDGLRSRLPGSVLLARERLVERLRGVSVSENRQSSGSLSNTHQNDFFTQNLLETRNSNNSMPERVYGSWQRNHQLGLNQDELKCLHLEVFSCDEIETTMECTICLEGFEDGDRIACLVCTHRFHSGCLFPWVRVCAVCPNCRKPILVNVSLK